MKYQGSCLCGNVRFEIDGEFSKFILCHCSRCQKNTGSAHASNLFCKEGRLEWIKGGEFVKLFKLTATRHAKCFCLNCGSALPFSGSDGTYLVVPAGSLDVEIDIKPEAHIFCSSKATWDKDLENVAHYSEYPE
jgi:hypothetical protein